MDKVILNQNGLKKSSAVLNPVAPNLGYGEKVIQDNVYYSLKTKFLAVGIFLYFFFENGTLGILPENTYMVYRSVRISDLLLYIMVIYSLFRINEYKDLFKSKSLLVVKIFLSYMIFEFIYSAFVYKFDVAEYFFRLKLVWSSFLVFPYLLLLKRNGLGFLIKLIFPAAVIANILYILSAVTGTAYLPDVRIISQTLPGNLEVYRVYGGTFMGDFFFLGFIYYWFTKKFKAYQLIFAVLFIIPQILAFGRTAWASVIFIILAMAITTLWKRKKFKLVFRQVMLLSILLLSLAYGFIQFVPQSDYYIDALEARLLQGSDDVKNDEGSYGERTIFENEILLNTWLKGNNPLLGMGMHPLWVYRQESHEELLIYTAITDVTWPGVLAVYGVIGFAIALLFQIYYIKTSYKLIKSSKEQDIITFILIIMAAQMVFATIITYSYVLVSVGVLGMGSTLSFMVASVVYCYEKQKNEPPDPVTKNTISKSYSLYRSYSYSYHKSYREKD